MCLGRKELLLEGKAKSSSHPGLKLFSVNPLSPSYAPWFLAGANPFQYPSSSLSPPRNVQSSPSKGAASTVLHPRRAWNDNHDRLWVIFVPFPQSSAEQSTGESKQTTCFQIFTVLLHKMCIVAWSATSEHREDRYEKTQDEQPSKSWHVPWCWVSELDFRGLGLGAKPDSSSSFSKKTEKSFLNLSG